MTRRKIEIIFITTLVILTLVLFKTTVIYKNNLIEHLLTFPLFGIISIGFMIFNYRFINFDLIKNIIYSIVIIIISLILSFLSFGLIISLMQRLDKGTTPLGWTFNYTWFIFLIFGFLLILSTEFIGIRINKKPNK